jgi:hypothetical protein
VEEGREGRGTSWGRDRETSVSTLSFRVTEKFGLRYFDFDEGLVEEDVFFRPSEKTNGEESGGYCNISKRDDNDKGREKEGMSWLITAGDLRNDGGVSVQMERLAESGWNGMRLEIDSSKKMGRGEMDKRKLDGILGRRHPMVM